MNTKTQMLNILKQIKLESEQKALDNGTFSGYELVAKLGTIEDKAKLVHIELNCPSNDNSIMVGSDFICDSWRGPYDLPSAPYNDTYYSVEDVIRNILDSEGENVEGYKGGNFTLSMDDVIYIANYGDSNCSLAITSIEELEDKVILHTSPDMY